MATASESTSPRTPGSYFRAPNEAPTVLNLIEEIANLLDQVVIQNHQEAKSLLARKLEVISVRSGLDPLREEDQRFYNLSQQLMNRQGDIREWCVMQLNQDIPHLYQVRERYELNQVKNSLNTCNYSQAASEVFRMATLYTFKLFLESEVNDYERLTLAQALLEESKVRGKEIIKVHFPPFPHPTAAFGREKWEQYFGTLESEPSLPVDIVPILKSPCPFWKNRLIEETHFLVLIPAKVNGASFNLNLLQELIKRPNRNGYPASYSHFHSIAGMVQRDYGHKGIVSPYWILMTKDLLPESYDKTYQEQQSLIPQGYTTPKMIEISTGLLAMQTENGSYPYQKSGWTRCEEIFSNTYRATIGCRPDVDQLLTGQTADHTKSVVFENINHLFSLGLVRRLT